MTDPNSPLNRSIGFNGAVRWLIAVAAVIAIAAARRAVVRPQWSELAHGELARSSVRRARINPLRLEALMISALSPWPRRAAFLYAALVFLGWILALGASPFSTGLELWPFAVALPWSLLLLHSGPFGLFVVFLAGLVNAGLLYLVLGGWRRIGHLRRRGSLLPPAA